MCSECVEHWDHGPPLKSPQTADMLNKCLRCDCLESEGFMCVKLSCGFVFLTEPNCCRPGLLQSFYKNSVCLFDSNTYSTHEIKLGKKMHFHIKISYYRVKQTAIGADYYHVIDQLLVASLGPRSDPIQKRVQHTCPLQLHHLIQKRSLVAPQNQDGDSHNAKFKASKWCSTNQWMMSGWGYP